MTAPLFRPRAVRDIDEIWTYTRERWGGAQADRYVTLIRDACLALGRGEVTGVDASAVRPGYRRVQVGRHLIFFRSLPGGVPEVVRILHERMDWPRHLRRG